MTNPYLEAFTTSWHDDNFAEQIRQIPFTLSLVFGKGTDIAVTIDATIRGRFIATGQIMASLATCGQSRPNRKRRRRCVGFCGMAGRAGKSGMPVMKKSDRLVGGLNIKGYSGKRNGRNGQTHSQQGGGAQFKHSVHQHLSFDDANPIVRLGLSFDPPTSI